MVFFKTQKPKGFSFQPRYYNESKERIEELRKRYGQERKDELDREELRVNIRQNWSRMRKTNSQNSSPRMMTLVAVALVLGILAYLFLK